MPVTSHTLSVCLSHVATWRRLTRAVATVGTTSSGAIDAIAEIGEVGKSPRSL